MTRLLKNSWFFLLVILVGCKDKPASLSLPFINKPDFTPEWIEKKDPAYSSIHRIPAFSFTDQNGGTVTEKTVDGKIYVADFFLPNAGASALK